MNKLPRKIKKGLVKHISLCLIGYYRYTTKWERKADNWMKRQNPNHRRLIDPVIPISKDEMDALFRDVYETAKRIEAQKRNETTN